MNSVKVLVADNQYLSSAGFKQICDERNDLEYVGKANNQQDLLKSLSNLGNGVLVIDYSSGGDLSLETIKKVKSIQPETSIMVITADDHKQHIFQALEYGVNSFLTKNCSREEIINAILASARKEKFFCNKVLNLILEKHLSPEEDENCNPSKLTTRELEIVELIAEGKSTKEIASHLFLSTHTVYTHRKNIMKKLGVNSGAELILYAIKTGLVSNR